MSVEELAGRMRLPFHIKPGAVVVLEGLDATGKTTQHEKMERACMGMGTGKAPLFDPMPLFLHMPSAGTHVGQAIYDMTETMGADLDPLARQFLHLASHAQSVETMIKPALAEGQPVILDRWWWSTMAYGWYGGNLRDRISRTMLLDLCQTVWDGVEPDLVAIFSEPHKEDRHNTPDVMKGYRWLTKQFPDAVEIIHIGTEGDQGEQLYTAMADRNIYRSA